jgi:hypothetical protein
MAATDWVCISATRGAAPAGCGTDCGFGCGVDARGAMAATDRGRGPAAGGADGRAGAAIGGTRGVGTAGNGTGRGGGTGERTGGGTADEGRSSGVRGATPADAGAGLGGGADGMAAAAGLLGSGERGTELACGDAGWDFGGGALRTPGVAEAARGVLDSPRSKMTSVNTGRSSPVPSLWGSSPCWRSRALASFIKVLATSSSVLPSVFGLGGLERVIIGQSYARHRTP